MVCEFHLSEAVSKKKRLEGLAHGGGEMWSEGWNPMKAELTEFAVD